MTYIDICIEVKKSIFTNDYIDKEYLEKFIKKANNKQLLKICNILTPFDIVYLGLDFYFIENKNTSFNILYSLYKAYNDNYITIYTTYNAIKNIIAHPNWDKQKFEITRLLS